MSAPRQYPGVMVSSTFADLREHRAALMSAIQGQQLHAVAMESDSALPAGTVLDSSLRKVREAAGYVGIVSHRYGQIPVCDANPEGLSLTHLEYREAVRLGRPILIFIMGEDHQVRIADIERDPAKQTKLDELREEVKLAEGELHRVYRVFSSLEDFTKGAIQSVAELRRLLETEPTQVVRPALDGVPGAPDLYACPRYLGSHPFVGRQEQLATLSEWASTAESRTVLLFEAIGGTGKSILTWEWINHYATGVRDWAGRFWYSFYEAGAVMADFCRHALAYMTGEPLASFDGVGDAELGDLLVRRLESRPWLLVLDGLERILVAYHRYDAAQLLDEDAGASDEISDRHPCAAIRPADEELLRRLAAVGSSKILISSRLVPRVLLNQASQPIPGVLHQRLPGLRPADAESLMRRCGVTGDGQVMRAYLQRHCDCHPLVTGIVAGLVNDYMLARGDFDAWAQDSNAGGHLDISELDLVRKRNHILRSALAALPGPSRQLLSTLAMLAQAAPYDALDAVTPQLSATELRRAVIDLEQRGLLQYEWQSRRYDLHPVVRAVASGGLRKEDRQVLGQRVVDHFSSSADGAYLYVSGLEELLGHVTVVRTLLQMGQLQAAFVSYNNGLDAALLHKLEEAPETLSLLRPFFGDDWSSVAPEAAELTQWQVANLKNDVGCAFGKLGNRARAFEMFEMAAKDLLDIGSLPGCAVTISNLAIGLGKQNRLARAVAFAELALELAELSGDDEALFATRVEMFELMSEIGRSVDAQVVWSAIDLARPWDVNGLKAGVAELALAESRFEQGSLTWDELASIEDQGRKYGKRMVVRRVHSLRGQLHCEQGEWAAAAVEFETAVSMARQTGVSSLDVEGVLALARLRLGQLPNVRAEIERLSCDNLVRAELWQAAGDRDRAAAHALAAYRFAWADGEPYVRRAELSRVVRILEDLGVEIPVLPPYDAEKDPPSSFEQQVRKFIARELKRRSR